MITYQVGQVKAHPTQTDLSPYWIKHSIVCAWTAVGVIPPLEALAHHGVTCPSPLTTVQTCAGKIAGTYCDPDPRSGFASFSCSGKTVSTSSGAQCPTGKYCHRTLGSVHSPAILDTNGKLQCFDEPQPF